MKSVSLSKSRLDRYGTALLLFVDVAVSAGPAIPYCGPQGFPHALVPPSPTQGFSSLRLLLVVAES